MSNLEVLILGNYLQEPVQCLLTLSLCEAINAGDMVSNTKYRLPARYGISTNNWMHSLQLGPNILRGASGLAIEFKTIGLGAFFKTWLSVCRGQILEELLIWFRQAIVELIS